MGIVFRQSVKTSFVIIAGAALGALTIWLSTKFIADKQQFGFTRTLTQQALTLSQILLLGLAGTLFVYTHRYVKNVEKRKVLLIICLGTPLIASILFTLFYFVFRTTILNHFQPLDRPLMAEYFNWLPIYMLLFLYMSLLEQYLGSQMKVAVSAFMREVLLRVLNIIIIILFAYDYISFHSLVISTILIYLVPVVIFLFLSAKTKDFSVSLNFSVFKKEEYKDILHFSWYHFLLSISITLMSSLDVLALPIYDHKGVTAVAVYAVAVYVISFLQIPSKAFLTSSFSILTTAFTEKDMKKAKDIFFRSSINLLIPTVAIAILICCNLQNAVSIIGNDKNYSDMAPVVIILIIGRFVDISTGMNDQVLSITNYYKFNFYVSIAITIVLFFMLRYLVPIYSIIGAAFSTTTAVILFNICKYIFIWKKLDMQPYSPKSLLVILAGLPALAAGYFFPYLFNEARHIYIHTFIDAAIRSTIIIIVYMLMLIWLKPSEDLEVYLASIKKNKRLF